MASHSYRVGVLPWTLALGEERLEIRAAWGTTRITLSRVSKLGIACSSYDAATLALPSSRSSHARRLRWREQELMLPPGPAGLVLVYEAEAGKVRDVAATFPVDDPEAIALVQAVLDDCLEAEFCGVGATPQVRIAMGLGGGDLWATLLMFLVLGSIVALLMWAGVL